MAEGYAWGHEEQKQELLNAVHAKLDELEAVISGGA